MAEDIYKSVDCCGNPYMDSVQEKAFIFIRKASEMFDEKHVQVFQEDLFGKNTCTDDYLNDYLYLLAYLSIMQKERQDYIDFNGIDRDASYYIEAYNIKCIAQSFDKRGDNIDHLLSIYGVAPYEQVLNDGVNYMEIEGDDPPINRVRN